MFIALEGADGTGKTTLRDVLSNKLGAVAYSTPPKKYKELRCRIDKDASVDEHYRFYLNGIHEASREISGLINDGNKIVCDRYWLSTYTHHQVMGAAVSKADFESIVFPTLTVVLALNHEVQIKRMFDRGMSDGDRREFKNEQGITEAFFRNVLEFNAPFVLLDVQHFSPEACCEIVLKTLEF